MLTKPTDKTLSNNHLNRRGDEERLNIHIDEPSERTRRVVGVQSAENKVTC